MVADNKADDCLPLTKYFQLAFTRGGNNQPSPLDTNCLNPAPRNDQLLSVRTRTIEHYFPQINQNFTGLQQTQNVIQLANIHRSQIAARQDDKRRLSRAQSKQNLAPIWHRIANSKKSEWSVTVQAVYDKAKFGIGEHDLTMVTGVAMVTITVSLTWYMTTKAAIDKGATEDYFEIKFAIHPKMQKQIHWKSSRRTFKTHKKKQSMLTKTMHKQIHTFKKSHQWKTAKNTPVSIM